MDNTSAHTSHDYDAHIRQTIPFYDRFHFETLDLIETYLPKCATWLDTGCGTGHFLELAHEVFPECQFYGADPSLEMLERAKARLQAFSNMTLLPPCPTEALPLERLKTLQVITAIQCHHYLRPEERQVATQRCYAALETGGIYVTFENSHPETPTGTQLGLARWARFQRARGREAETIAQHTRRFGTHYFPITLDEQRAGLKGAGFKTVELFWHSYMQTGWYGIK